MPKTNTPMLSSTAISQASRATLVSRLAWALSGIPTLLFSMKGERPPGSTTEIYIESMHFIAELCILGTILGFSASQSPNYGKLGGVGFAVAFVGSGMLFLITLLRVIGSLIQNVSGLNIADRIGEAVTATALFVLGVSGSILGFMVLGSATIRAKIFP